MLFYAEFFMEGATDLERGENAARILRELAASIEDGDLTGGTITGTTKPTTGAWGVETSD